MGIIKKRHIVMEIIKKFAPLQILWYITYDEGDQGSQTGESLM